MSSETPFVCNMDVFTPAQREAHIATTMELIQAIQNVQEVENGYEFTFPNETNLISKIAEFISNERLCCPFLTFHLSLSSTTEPISLSAGLLRLSLSGTLGTQEFLREEFSGAMQ